MTNHPNRSVQSKKSDFVRSLLGMTPDQLAHQYQVTGEVMCEEEDHALIPTRDKQPYGLHTKGPSPND